MVWHPSALWRDVLGTAGVEMALVMPVLLALVFTTLEGANYLWCEHKVVKGVRDGARYAGRTSFSNFNNCPTVLGETAVKNLTRTGYLTGDNPNVTGSDNPVISGWTNSDVTVSCAYVTGTGGLYNTRGGSAPVVTVSASVNYPSLFGLLGFDTSGAKLNASAQSPVMGL